MAVATWRDKSGLVVENDRSSRSPARVIDSAMLSNLLNQKLTVSSRSCRSFVPPRAAHELERLLAT